MTRKSNTIKLNKVEITVQWFCISRAVLAGFSGSDNYIIIYCSSV